MSTTSPRAKLDKTIEAVAALPDSADMRNREALIAFLRDVPDDAAMQELKLKVQKFADMMDPDKHDVSSRSTFNTIFSEADRVLFTRHFGNIVEAEINTAIPGNWSPGTVKRTNKIYNRNLEKQGGVLSGPLNAPMPRRTFLKAGAAAGVALLPTAVIAGNSAVSDETEQAVAAADAAKKNAGYELDAQKGRLPGKLRESSSDALRALLDEKIDGKPFVSESAAREINGLINAREKLEAAQDDLSHASWQKTKESFPVTIPIMLAGVLVAATGVYSGFVAHQRDDKDASKHSFGERKREGAMRKLGRAVDAELSQALSAPEGVDGTTHGPTGIEIS